MQHDSAGTGERDRKYPAEMFGTNARSKPGPKPRRNCLCRGDTCPDGNVNATDLRRLCAPRCKCRDNCRRNTHRDPGRRRTPDALVHGQAREGHDDIGEDAATYSGKARRSADDDAGDVPKRATGWLIYERAEPFRKTETDGKDEAKQTEHRSHQAATYMWRYGLSGYYANDHPRTPLA